MLLKKLGLGTRILIGIVIGFIIGFASPDLTKMLSPLGEVFLRMLKMLIVPLVFFSITSGVCKMGGCQAISQYRTSICCLYLNHIRVSSCFRDVCWNVLRHWFGNHRVSPGWG